MMKVAILIPTYARHAFLQESVACALAQSYPVEVIVLNDCPHQQLTCSHPMVCIVNEYIIHGTLGDKRNHMLALAIERGHERVCWLDDDDLCLPTYVEGLIEAAKSAPACVGERAWSYYKQDDMLQPRWEYYCWPNEMLVDPTLALSCRYPSLDSGEDQAMRAHLTAVPQCARSFNRAYVYRWGQGSFHVSGAGDPLGGRGFRADANQRMQRGQEPKGKITIIPALRAKYEAPGRPCS